MALAALAAASRPGRRLRGPGPGRGHWTAAWRSRSRREAAEAEAEAPVFQYVGERAARVDRIFVWGFSFSGALGVPTFVLPGSGPEPRAGLRPRRRIQPVPYRLELDQKVRTATPLSPPEAPRPRGEVSDAGWSRFREDGLPSAQEAPGGRPRAGGRQGRRRQALVSLARHPGRRGCPPPPLHRRKGRPRG